MNKGEVVLNEKQDISIYKDEKRGIWTIMILFLVSWGFLASPWWAIRFVAWVALGLLGFTLWRIFDGLFERMGVKNEKRGKFLITKRRLHKNGK